MNEHKICATCKYNKREDGEFYCSCESSDIYGLSTAYDDECEEWEAKS